MASVKTLKALATSKNKVKQTGVIGSEAERKRRDESLKDSKIAELTQKKSEAEACLSQGQFEASIPVALTAMNLSVELFGKESIDVVPCYLLLAEANLGTQQLGQAEWYLSQANWAVVKTPDCSFHIRSIVHRCFGKLYAQQGRTEEALTHLSSNVYYCARESGPQSIDCADGYFLLAQVFYMSSPDDGFWLKREHTGQFCHLQGGDMSEEVPLTLGEGGYGRSSLKFSFDEEGCLVHLASGMYVQPLSRAATPANNSPLVLRTERIAPRQDPPVIHSFSFVNGMLRHGPSGRVVIPAQAVGSDDIQLVLRDTDDEKLALSRWSPDGKQSAISLFSKVLQIWSDLLAGPEGVDAAIAGSATLSDVVIDEAGRMVERVLEVMVAENGDGAASVGQCRYTMGLIYHYLGANSNAYESYDLAAKIYTDLEDTEKVDAISERIAQVQA